MPALPSYSYLFIRFYRMIFNTGYNISSCGGAHMKTMAYGFPKLGNKREFKSLLEGFWSGKVSDRDFKAGMDAL
ncbi:MAG: hypothetical protein ACK4SM_03615, partial [Aquificaceae bacterium]